MCGICGFVTASETTADPSVLHAMTDLLIHRGPDAQGGHLGPSGAALGIRRLSIVDLETGDQPIPNESGTVHVVCNGMIYNAPELQRELEGRGHRFRGHSDVEVIPHLYEEMGLDFLQRLRGMFGLALWDEEERRLVLARDRLGLKPLYHARGRDGALYFASEAKAIVATGQVDASLNPQGLGETLHFGSPLFRQTLFKGISQLQPGHRLVHQGGSTTIEAWWDLDLTPPETPPFASEGEWVEGIRETFLEVVDIHLRGDVPVAAWLSPGLDSSAVTALAARTQSRPVPTFSMGFQDPYFDELQGQKILSDFPEYSLDGTRVTFPDDTLRLLPDAVWHHEQPLTLQVPYYLLAREMTGRLKVALTGQGSDELFTGYSWHTVDDRWRHTYPLPSFVRKLLAALLPRSKELDKRALTLPAPMAPSRYSHILWMGWPKLRQAMVPELAAATESPRSSDAYFQPPPGFHRWERIRQMQYVEFKTRLASSINLGLDRSAMSGSVEARLPFLDHVFVELCTKLPRSLRRTRMEKYVFRRAMEPFLPKEIVWRDKRGLRSPTPSWSAGQGPVPEYVDELLSDEAVRKKGYFDPGAVRELRKQGPPLSGTLSQILALHLWDEAFVQGQGKPVAL